MNFLRFVFQTGATAVLAFIGLGCSDAGPAYDASTAVWQNFDGEKALAHIEKIVAMGPRPAGSDGIEKSRVYLEEQLRVQGWQVRRQAFKRKTSIGEIEFVNLRARFGREDSEALWKPGPRVLLCSHYDTKLYRDLEFVGANDPGSSMGALLEAGRVIATQPALAKEIELVFFDGEEAFGPSITGTDGLFGSTYYAGEMMQRKPEYRPRWGILLDMVGDQDLNIEIGSKLPPMSLQAQRKIPVDQKTVDDRRENLLRLALEAAESAGHRKYFGVSSSYITDDHVPLNQVGGIPTINLIDFDYPYWHTPSDTVEKLSAESLTSAGQTTLLLIEKHLME